jgi:hypothetical protein
MASACPSGALVQSHLLAAQLTTWSPCHDLLQLAAHGRALPCFRARIHKSNAVIFLLRFKSKMQLENKLNWEKVYCDLHRESSIRAATESHNQISMKAKS